MDPQPSARHDVYFIAKGWRNFFFILVLLLLCLSAWLMIYPWFDPEFNLGTRMILSPIGAVSCAFMGYSLLFLRKHKVEVFDDRIVETRVFGNKVIPLAAMRGFRILSYNGDRYAQFIPRDPKGRKKKLGLQLRDGLALEAWLNGTLPNLDAEELEQEMKDILSDEGLGINEEHRSHALERARKFANALQFVSVGALLWVIFHPRPYETAIWTLVVLPFLAILSTRFFPGLIRLDGPKHGARPSVAIAILASPIALSLRALRDFDILAWGNFWLPFSVFTALLFLMTVLHFPEVRKKTGQMILYSLFCLVYGYAATVCLNGLHDSSGPSVYRAKVLEKRISSGRHETRYLKLSPWGPRSGPEEVDVGKSLYGRVDVSDSVTVYVKSGNFKLPWFYILK